jgi:hypothetical protein
VEAKSIASNSERSDELKAVAALKETNSQCESNVQSNPGISKKFAIIARSSNLWLQNGELEEKCQNRKTAICKTLVQNAFWCSEEGAPRWHRRSIAVLRLLMS